MPMLATVIPLALLLLVTELAVRALVPPERWHHVDAAHHWQIDPQLGWVQRANLDSYSLDSLTSEPIPLATNGGGLLPATATRERPADSARILLVGDSTIVGAGVAESQRIHQVLADELSGRGLRVDVVNAGTHGYSTDQTLLRLEQLIEPYAPDLVLHCITANDFVANTLDRNHGINKPSFRIDATGTLSANAFNFTASSAKGMVGLGSMVVDEVRFVKGEDAGSGM